MSSTPKGPGEDWSRESEALFRTTRFDHAPSAADRERVRRALAQRFSDTPALDTGANVARPWTANLSRLLKIGVSVTLVAAGGIAAKQMSDARSSRSELAPVQVVSPKLSADMSPTAATPQLEIVPAAASREADAERSEGKLQSKTARVVQARAATKQSRPRTKPQAITAAPESENGQPTSTRSAEAAQRTAEPSPFMQPIAAAASGEMNQAADDHAAAATSPTGRSETRSASPATGSRTPVATAAMKPGPQVAHSRAELVLVRKMQAAMSKAEPGHVLALCAEHEQRWPHGTFVQEREGLRAIALCKLEAKHALRHARDFLERYPRTPLGARVREACKLPIKSRAPTLMR